MPDYKKRNVHKHKKNIKNEVSDDIVMKPKKRKESAEKNQERKEAPLKRKNINLIRGNKLKIRKRKMFFAAASIILVFAISLFSLLTPTGIIESVVNFSSSLKFGNSYPVKLSGGMLLNTTSQGNHLFLVSTTNFECYNNNGKNIFSYQHGYQSPLAAVSEARTLLFDQSGKNYSIYNLNRELYSGQTDNKILCADITRNGYYAIATLSDSYSSQISVFNGKNEKIYEWYCSDYIINSAVLSPNGKTLAVSAVSAKDGSFVSKVYVIQYESATPKATFDYNGLVLTLKRSGTKGFTCVLDNSVDFYTWRKYKTSEFSSENNVLISKQYKSNTLLVTGRVANKNENLISIFDASGKQKYSFVFNNIIDAIEYKGSHIYILSENNVHHYSLSGEFIAKASANFGTSFIVPISQKEIAAITDSSIEKLSF